MELRVEQRAALLAYGYLRGTPYRVIERGPHWLTPPFPKPGPNWSRVRDLVHKYGAGGRTKEQIWDALVAWRKVPPAAESATVASVGIRQATASA